MTALFISAKAVTFAEKLLDMNEYTFEMVPGLVGRIAELLESKVMITFFMVVNW